MRTGIYVYESTTVTIEVVENGLVMAQLNGPLDFAALDKSNSLVLQPGIYRVVSTQPIRVSGNNIAVQLASGKDPWPDPDPGVAALLGGAITQDAVKSFFMTKGITV